MARAFRRKGRRFVARLDDVEREVVVGLMEQTHEFLAPVHREPTGNTFDDLVATLGVRDPQSGPGIDQEPRDPALERLLPSAHRDDPEMAAEFRRLTEHGLRERKTANLAIAIEALRGAGASAGASPDSGDFGDRDDSGDRNHDADDEGDQRAAEADNDRAGRKDRGGDKVKLDQAQAQAMVIALTDVRLLLGERLGLRTDADADALQDRLEAGSEDDPTLYLAAYYDFLTWLQESLAEALLD